MSDAFDVIPFEDIRGNWKKLGAGSFGNVYRGTYLGIDVAIKEVLPSNSYDVAKYFEREWRLMKEARHPNVVLYLGLSRAPDPDGRIFIISEYIENGNLRQYIYDKSKPFPWRLRLSFAIDIARALAYLHARKCIHRDLKGENLLVTANGRLKITDFGFARIAARNEEESKRLTFCGTDSYMSPEILLGEEFDLPTDIFSFGIILCEMAARRLADDHHFKRVAPTYAIDREEVRRLAGPGCPSAFVSLCLDCLQENPAVRPTVRVILDRLRDIEAEVLMRPCEEDDLHVGSIKFMTGGKARHSTALRIPSFGIGVGKDIRYPNHRDGLVGEISSSEESSDDELMEAVTGLSTISVEPVNIWDSAIHGHVENSTQPLLNSTSSVYSVYSTSVVRGRSHDSAETVPSLSSLLTIRASTTYNPPPSQPLTPATMATSNSGDSAPADSMLSIRTYQTAVSSVAPSTAAATGGGSSIWSLPLVHRFTLLRPGAKKTSTSNSPPRPVEGGWNPLELLFSSGLFMQKCDICTKRIGWKPVLECDDCGLRTHVKCGETAPRNCGLVSVKPGVQAVQPPSPVSKAKFNIRVTPVSSPTSVR